ncbi:uncharacterized protein METZ01_LOCUS288999 [marine metagenome]|uniref:Uncharacterized protein n=1 Tax=marine metagenome TaxID=408172 RepID=A0A382LK14_9ZZZZ
MKQYFLTIMALFSFTFAQERVMLEGEYTYKWGDNETVLVAKSLCYNMALRNMVESYQTFVASTTDIQNYEVRNDLIQTLSAGYLEDLTVVEERIEKEKNVAYYKLRAYVRPVEFKRALQQQVVRKLEIYKPKPVRENEYFAVLKQWELRNNDLCFIIQFKQDGGYNYEFEITYYDSDGFPLDGETIRLFSGNHKQGQIRKICQNLRNKPFETAYYEVWDTKSR